jgi:hypothetical protein
MPIHNLQSDSPDLDSVAKLNPMATPRSWLPRIEEILDVLRQGTFHLIDRAAVEALFELQRRAAINLMKDAGATAADGQLLLTRQALLAWVESIQKTEVMDMTRLQSARGELAYGVEQARALRRTLVEAGKPPTSFKVCEDVLHSSISSLPPEVSLGPGFLRIDFPPGDVEAALRSLYAFSMALANDMGTFRRITAGEDSSQAYTVDDFLTRLQNDKQHSFLDI